MLLVLVCHSNVCANGVAGDDVLKNFEAKRKTINTYRARFVQKKTLSLFDEVKVSTGIVIYQAPQKMIWKYDTPDKTQMRVDANSVSFYFPALNQIEIHPIEGGAGGSPFFFAFQATAPELKENFDVSEYSAGDGRLYRMDLFPKTDSIVSGLRSLTLWVGQSDYVPEKVLIQEISGDSTEIQLLEIEVDAPVTENELEFDAPEGTEVIQAGPEGF